MFLIDRNQNNGLRPENIDPYRYAVKKLEIQSVHRLHYTFAPIQAERLTKKIYLSQLITKLLGLAGHRPHLRLLNIADQELNHWSFLFTFKIL